MIRRKGFHRAQVDLMHSCIAAQDTEQERLNLTIDLMCRTLQSMKNGSSVKDIMEELGNFIENAASLESAVKGVK